MIRTFPVVHPDQGVARQVLSDSPELMVVSFAFEEGAKGALHSHPHVQSTYVKTGKFRFSVAGNSFDVKPGDSFVIPSGAHLGMLERLLKVQFE